MRSILGARRLIAVCLVAGLLVARPARADKVEDLTRALITDDSYKVRVQAALVLGKLKDKRAVPALVKALGDDNASVRAVSAQALGLIGDAGAGAALRRLAQTDESDFVKREANVALKRLTDGSAPASPAAAKFFMAVGPMSAKGRKVSSESVELFRSALIKELGRTPGVTLEPGADKGRTGYWIDGNIVRLATQDQGSFIEITCDVKVLVASWPSKSIILWTDGGATVQTGSSGEAAGRKDCLEAAVQAVQQNIATFLKGQG